MHSLLLCLRFVAMRYAGKAITNSDPIMSMPMIATVMITTTIMIIITMAMITSSSVEESVTSTAHMYELH